MSGCGYSDRVIAGYGYYLKGLGELRRVGGLVLASAAGWF